MEKNDTTTPTYGAYSFSDAADKMRLWKQAHEAAAGKMDRDFLLRVLSRTIKRDDDNKLITFLSMILNYTYQDQQNVMFQAPSSTGKSYIALECAKYFPKEDVDKRGYTSRRAFFHKNSELQTADGKPLEDRAVYLKRHMDEWDQEHPTIYAPDTSDASGKAVAERRRAAGRREERKAVYRRFRDEWDAVPKLYVVNLEKRIQIFKDTPDDQVLSPLRSLLSHDEKELLADITDKSSSGGNLTKTVKLVGYPTMIFCQASFNPDEQERTRFSVISPDMTQEKLGDSLDLQAESLGNREAFSARLDGDPEGAMLRVRVEMVKAANIREVVIRPEDMAGLLAWFKGGVGGEPRDLSPRDQRDFPRIVAMAKGYALFNLPQRRYTVGGVLFAEPEDIEAAKGILSRTIISNRIGLPPYVYDWWRDTLRELLDAAGGEGLSKVGFSQSYYLRFKSRLSEKGRRRLIQSLEEAGFLEEKTDPGDKRSTRLYALGVGVGDVKNSGKPSEAKLEVSTSTLGAYSWPQEPHETAKIAKSGDELSPMLRQHLDKVAEVLRRAGHRGVREEDFARGVGLPVEETRLLLKALQRDGHAFETLGGWRWVT